MSVIVELTARELRDGGACARDMELFAELLAGHNDSRQKSGKKPSKRLRIRWTPLHQIWMAAAYPDFAWLLSDLGLMPSLILRGVDLTGAVLRYAVLRYSVLTCADLSYADLRHAVLIGADMRYAVLIGADMRYADLRHADMSYAVLTGADLTGARVDLSRPAPAGWRAMDTGLGYGILAQAGAS